MAIVQKIITGIQACNQIKVAKKPFTGAGLKFQKSHSKDFEGNVFVELVEKQSKARVCTPFKNGYAWLSGHGKGYSQAINDLIEQVKGKFLLHCENVYEVSKDAKKVERGIRPL